jgi:hypothetical protein
LISNSATSQNSAVSMEKLRSRGSGASEQEESFVRERRVGRARSLHGATGRDEQDKEENR